MTLPGVAVPDHTRTRMQRILRFPLVRLLIAILFLSIALTLANLLMSATGLAGPWGRALITIVVIHATYVGYVRFIEKRPAVELDRWQAGKGLVLGTVGGVLLFSAVAGVMALSGALRVESWNGWGSLGASLAIAGAAAYVEEVLFRGVVYRLLEEVLGTWLCIALTALLFGLLHGGNPNANLLAVAAVALEAGVLLAALYVRSRRLWAPIGLHLGWNFTQGGIFGLAVSGNQRAGVVSVHTEGPGWLTGGAFGPEASIIAVLLCLLVAAALLYSAHQRRLIMAPAWSARRRGAHPQR